VSGITFTAEEWRLLQAHLRGALCVYHSEAGSDKCFPHKKDTRLDWTPPNKPMFEWCDKRCQCGHDCGSHTYPWDETTRSTPGLCVCLEPGCGCKKFAEVK